MLRFLPESNVSTSHSPSCAVFIKRVKNKIHCLVRDIVQCSDSTEQWKGYMVMVRSQLELVQILVPSLVNTGTSDTLFTPLSLSQFGCKMGRKLSTSGVVERVNEILPAKKAFNLVRAPQVMPMVIGNRDDLGLLFIWHLIEITFQEYSQHKEMRPESILVSNLHVTSI